MNIVITPGDPEGIGPEVTAKALRALASELKSKKITIFGSLKPFKNFRSRDSTLLFMNPLRVRLQATNPDGRLNRPLITFSPILAHA